MRSVIVFVTGILVGVAVQSGIAQQSRIVGSNHVAVSVADYANATNVYGKQMGQRHVSILKQWCSTDRISRR